MGVYEVLDIPGCEGAQVKCWQCEMCIVRVGDEVPAIGGHESYVVALREGGYIIIEDGKVARWEAELTAEGPIFDKWGGVLGPESTGIMGEGYFNGG